jgi:hypothetical protein
VEHHRHIAIRMQHAIFRAPRQIDDPRAGQGLHQFGREGAAQALAADLDAFDPPVVEVTRQAADRGFDFWKFWHSGDVRGRRKEKMRGPSPSRSL